MENKNDCFMCEKIDYAKRVCPYREWPEMYAMLEYQDESGHCIERKSNEIDKRRNYCS